MIKNFIIFVSAAIFMSFYAGGTASAAEVKDEIALKKGPGAYMEVRHITITGTNEEIGKALADIAREDYGTKLVKYAEPVYAKARIEYMKENYPIMLERMKGVAKSYGVTLEKTDLDTSALYYWHNAPQCSAVFFPKETAAAGRNFYVSNRDYYLASMSEVMGEQRKPGEEDFSARVFVIELYPDKGYSSIGVGILDLLSINIDAVNSAGLAVAVLQDDTLGMDRSSQDLSRIDGLYIYQLVRLIIDTCATVEEAKEAILTNKITMALLPAHFIVMDRSGKSFIYERSVKDSADKIVDGRTDAPLPVTNHSIYDYPTVDKLPAPLDDDYDTFNRYRRLANFFADHSGKYAAADGRNAMSLVFGRVQEASEGGHHDLPLRTLYTAAVDLDEGTVSVRFYERDGTPDPKTGLATLIFSEPIEFRIKR